MHTEHLNNYSVKSRLYFCLPEIASSICVKSKALQWAELKYMK